MLEPDGRNVSLIKYHVEKGEHDRAKEIIEELLRGDPENVLHYLLMAYYYFLVGDNDEKLDWIEEVLSREPENEDIIESIISLLDMGKERDFAIEILKTGLRLYPHNPIFHLQYAELLKIEDLKQAQASYKEAIRLDPQNYLALGTYAVLLYRLGDMKKAEQYEEQSLKYHPEDTRLLVDFAWIAYQRKKYKKAQYLIHEAMRLDPNDELIRKYYKIIYPSKNSFVRSTKGMNEILGKIFYTLPILFGK